MNTWAIAAAGAQRQAAPDLWSGLGGAVGAIGEADFGSHVLRCLNHALPVDFWSVYQVGSDLPPTMYVSASLNGQDVSDDCFQRYRQGLYKTDQTFASARKYADAGSLAMTLWNEAEIPEPHRDQIYRRHDILERLSVVSLGVQGAQGALALNLYRFRKSGAFAGREVDAASHLADFLLRCVAKHLAVHALVAESATVQARTVRSRLLAQCARLTPRELDVCERLVRGWTYDGIAQDMGISVASAKTYRARAFDRLGIHFRNQLFTLVN
jgi:DNA-binding CsgD family transcriptional regulator